MAIFRIKMQPLMLKLIVITHEPILRLRNSQLQRQRCTIRLERFFSNLQKNVFDSKTRCKFL
jgi:hypothetical protein